MVAIRGGPSGLFFLKCGSSSVFFEEYAVAHLPQQRQVMARVAAPKWVHRCRHRHQQQCRLDAQGRAAAHPPQWLSCFIGLHHWSCHLGSPLPPCDGGLPSQCSGSWHTSQNVHQYLATGAGDRGQ